mmetsp:Transcript_29654/g.31861  ORF Transcript_29654/g.31861 Transcript_29654/m.31861 type:complete len:421 (-) Transcript_29654:554-1816(-)
MVLTKNRGCSYGSYFVFCCMHIIISFSDSFLLPSQCNTLGGVAHPMIVLPLAFSSQPQPPPISPIQTTKTDINSHNCSRRDVFQTSSVALIVVAAFLATRPAPVFAVTVAQQQQQSKSNPYKIWSQMSSVPTFCLVTNEGIPFTWSTNSTTQTSSLSANGYFFLSFEAAAQALQRARQQAQVQGDGTPNNSASASGGGVSVSSTAKIIIVPLGVALQQSLDKTVRREVINSNNNDSNNNNNVVTTLLPTQNHLVVSSEGMEDAKRIEMEFINRGGINNLYNNQKNYPHKNNLNNDYENNNNNKINSKSPSRWNRKGTIPLFYMDGLTLSDGKEPRYFNQDDLLEEFTDQHPGKELPPTRLVELVDLYRTALDESRLDEVQNLALVPVAETVRVGKELLKTSSSPNYNFKQIYLVDSDGSG